jgi:hypothetical protein
MAISKRPPLRKAVSEADIDAVISKGSTVIKDVKPDMVKHFNIRLTSDILSQIDRHRERRPRKPGSPKLGISTHDWIVEAVLEKLEKENKSLKRS